MFKFSSNHFIGNIEFKRKTRSDKGKKRGPQRGSKLRDTAAVAGTGGAYLGTLALSDQAIKSVDKGFNEVSNRAKSAISKSPRLRKLKNKVKNLPGRKLVKYGATLALADAAARATSSTIGRVRNRGKKE